MTETNGPDGSPQRPRSGSGWKYRFDSPPAPRTLAAVVSVEPSDVLSLFRAWHTAETTRAECRESPRYIPAESLAYVGWWGGGRFLVTRAVLVNLGPGGALVELDRSPPTSQPIWLCLSDPRPTFHVQARALEVSPAVEGLRRVRLSFHTPCPLEFFRAVGRQEG
jgi:hypothetical protein